MAVITPDATPLLNGDPQPEIVPSSDAASVNPIEIPAPTDAARPTRKVFQVSPVAKAAAKMGASVETDPSISPASPGCTQVRTNCRCASALSAERTLGGRC